RRDLVAGGAVRVSGGQQFYLGNGLRESANTITVSLQDQRTCVLFSSSDGPINDGREAFVSGRSRSFYVGGNLRGQTRPGGPRYNVTLLEVDTSSSPPVCVFIVTEQ